MKSQTINEKTSSPDSPAGVDSPKWIWSFAEGDGTNKRLLGGKGANLCEMTRIGINVPPGFVVSTEACLAYLDSPDGTLPAGVMEQAREQMARLEAATGRRFGGAEDPLLVSVRSGSALSMPGMMDTILNLGLNEESLGGLIKQTGDQRFGYDAYRRLIQLFGKVALGIQDEHFDEQFESVKELAGAAADVDLQAEDLKEIVRRFLQVVRKHTGRPFPSKPYEQLEVAIKAVFDSWMGRRAVDYRREFGITSDMANGTAANVVAMVFGNMGSDCSTGVAFTRDPGTGENKLYGEYLVNAQGEDVVAGIRTPHPIREMAATEAEMYDQLQELRRKLEEHYREVQDFEFTNERGTLYCLQTRNGKMNASARVRTSVEMVDEGLISREEALLRVTPEDLEQILYARIDPDYDGSPLATGLAASPGAASGEVVFDADRAELLGRQGRKLILVREETKPEDIHGFFAAQGILTSRGGGTSHAAVVARGMGKPCVAGAEGLMVDEERAQAIAGELVVKEGDTITIDGATGHVYLGDVPTVEAEFSQELETLLTWADEAARLKVMANADTPEDAARAIRFGAMGIGLCRTERMFNAPERLPIVLDMIVAEDDEQRAAALQRLLPMQRADFRGIFEAMSPRPVTIRLLDPPLHEFLPSQERLEEEILHLHRLRDALRGMDVLTSTMRVLDADAPEAAIGFGDGASEVTDVRRVDRVIARKEALLRGAQALRRRGGGMPQSGGRGSSTDHGPAGVHVSGADARGSVRRRGGSRRRGRVRREDRLRVRNDDRGRPGLPPGGEPGRSGGFLLLRDQRSDAGHVLVQPRRCRDEIPAALQRARNTPGQPVRGSGSNGARAPHGGYGSVGEDEEARPGGGDLRRARRPCRLHPLLPRDRSGLRLLLTAAHSGGSIGGGPRQRSARDEIDLVVGANALVNVDRDLAPGGGALHGAMLDLEGVRDLLEIGRVTAEVDGVAHAEVRDQLHDADVRLVEVMGDRADELLLHVASSGGCPILTPS
jgi:pyruvate,orthophosphate dikinase